MLRIEFLEITAHCSETNSNRFLTASIKTGAIVCPLAQGLCVPFQCQFLNKLPRTRRTRAADLGNLRRQAEPQCYSLHSRIEEVLVGIRPQRQVYQEQDKMKENSTIKTRVGGPYKDDCTTFSSAILNEDTVERGYTGMHRNLIGCLSSHIGVLGNGNTFSGDTFRPCSCLLLLSSRLNPSVP